MTVEKEETQNPPSNPQALSVRDVDVKANGVINPEKKEDDTNMQEKKPPPQPINTKKRKPAIMSLNGDIQLHRHSTASQRKPPPGHLLATSEHLPLPGSSGSSDKRDGYNRLLELLQHDRLYQNEILMGRRIGFYRVGKDLGAGNFSKCKWAIHILTKEKVAIKIVDKARLDFRTKSLFEREYRNMENMHHPNVIRLFEVMETVCKLYMVLELADNGEMFTKVVDKGRLTEEESKVYFAQIVSAVQHIHNKGIIHRDIKAENVFLSGDCVKVGDFGFSNTVERGNHLKTFCGSPPYAAPELFQDRSYDGYPVDIWAMGILLHFMVTGNTPFRADNVADLKNQIMQGVFVIPSYVSEQCQDLIHAILRVKPTDRMSLEDMVKHPWLKGCVTSRQYSECSPVPSEEELQTSEIARKVWRKLRRYGIDDHLMRESAQKGAKNAVIGIYRIVLFQVQTRGIESNRNKFHEDPKEQMKEAEKDRLQAEREKQNFLLRHSSRLCNIL